MGESMLFLLDPALAGLSAWLAGGDCVVQPVNTKSRQIGSVSFIVLFLISMLRKPTTKGAVKAFGCPVGLGSYYTLNRPREQKFSLRHRERGQDIGR